MTNQRAPLVTLWHREPRGAGTPWGGDGAQEPTEGWVQPGFVPPGGVPSLGHPSGTPCGGSRWGCGSWGSRLAPNGTEPLPMDDPTGGHPRRNSAPRTCRRVPCLQHRSPEQARPGVPKVTETPEEQHRGVQGACRAVHPRPGAELRVLRTCARSPPACSVPAHAYTCTQLACTLVCTLVGCF